MIFVVDEGIDHCIDAIVICGRDRNPDPATAFGGNSFINLFPSAAAVRRFEDAAAGAVRRRVNEPGRPTYIP